jgi:phage gp36-like protein
MRLSIGLPGQSAQDDELSQEVKSEHGLGDDSGTWNKRLWPPNALKPIKAIDEKITKYHDKVTIRFDKGMGILPATLYPEYCEKMRVFKSERERLVQDHFVAKYDEFVEWAKKNQNGTFDASLYPGADVHAKKFYVKTIPIPVPDSAHFETNVKDLLGLDSTSVDKRIEDATAEGQRELLRRMMAPVEHMAKILSGEKPRIYKTLISNIGDIAKLVPALNLMDDPELNKFAKDMESLAENTPDSLRDSVHRRTMVQSEAKELMDRLSGYKL